MAANKVRIAKVTTDHVAELIANCHKPSDAPLAPAVSAESFARRLQGDAYDVYLTGQAARARALNKLADRLLRASRQAL